MSIIILLFITTIADPTPNGGLICNGSLDTRCRGGWCVPFIGNNTIDYFCHCYEGYGNVDCSYRRTDRNLAAGLQIGLSFAGIFGVGNFILGYTAIAVGQLILGLTVYLCICPLA